MSRSAHGMPFSSHARITAPNIMSGTLMVGQTSRRRMGGNFWPARLAEVIAKKVKE